MRVKQTQTSQKQRRIIGVFVVLLSIIGFILFDHNSYELQPTSSPSVHDTTKPSDESNAMNILATLQVKGRAPKTDYARTQFGDGWETRNGCDTRNIILARDLKNEKVDDMCRIVSGTLHDPYTGSTIQFMRGTLSSQAVQIDHVVALSNAWQTGAQQLNAEERARLANDPLELLAVDGKANQQKSDSDAATWLPSNKAFRCQYIARQIAVKQKYQLWVTPPEKKAMITVLQKCPQQSLPTH